MAYWGDQLVPGPVYKEWWQGCVADYEEMKCSELEIKMDGLIGKAIVFFFFFLRVLCCVISYFGSVVFSLLYLVSHVSVGPRPLLYFAGNLNPYALDFPMCTGENSNNKDANGSDKGAVLRSQRLALKNHMRKSGLLSGGAVENNEGDGVLKTPYEPCAEDYTVP